MPLNPDNSLRAFTTDEINAMELESVDVRHGAHPTETREIDQSTMRRQLLCKWAERYNAVELICGNQSFYKDTDGLAHISRLDPDPTWGQHPYALNFVATKIERMTGHGRPNGEDKYGVPQYPQCRLDVMYQMVPWDFASDATILLRGRNEFSRYTWTAGDEVGGENITGKGGFLRFWRDPATGAGVPNGQPIPYSYNVIRPFSEFSYKWENVPYEAAKNGSSLWGKLFGYMGMINSVTFPNVPGETGFAPGTVQYLGAARKLRRPQAFQGAVSTGYRMYSIELKFLYAPYGHLNLRNFDLAGAGLGNGWFMVGTSGFKTPGTLNDFESIVVGARDLNDLWVP